MSIIVCKTRLLDAGLVVGEALVELFDPLRRLADIRVLIDGSPPRGFGRRGRRGGGIRLPVRVGAGGAASGGLAAVGGERGDEQQTQGCVDQDGHFSVSEEGDDARESVTNGCKIRADVVAAAVQPDQMDRPAGVDLMEGAPLSPSPARRRQEIRGWGDWMSPWMCEGAASTAEIGMARGPLSV